METNMMKLQGSAGCVPGGLAEETGTDRDALSQILLEQVLKVCLVEDYDREVLTLAVMDLLSELQPKNILEGMLAAQIAVGHFLGMTQLGKAAKSSNASGQQVHLQLGIKLQRTFISQIETLMKIRGHQQQKVLVEHVHVHSGGQAIVGPVTHPGGGGA